MVKVTKSIIHLIVKTRRRLKREEDIAGSLSERSKAERERGYFVMIDVLYPFVR